MNSIFYLRFNILELLQLKIVLLYLLLAVLSWLQLFLLDYWW
jgi:hypothetical protein